MKAITTSSFLTIFLLFSFVGIKAEEPTTTIKDKPHLIILTPTRNDKPERLLLPTSNVTILQKVSRLFYQTTSNILK